MLKLTIYRRGSTVEISSSKLLGKDFPSNKVVDYHFADSDGTTEIIKIRPYYRKKLGGVLNIFAEEEITENATT
jgi:hypothetical protein